MTGWSMNETTGKAIPMLLWCPICRGRHIDRGEFATKPHHTHACQECGHVWRPAIVATVGVQFLPGFKNEPEMNDEAIATKHRSHCASIHGDTCDCGRG